MNRRKSRDELIWIVEQILDEPEDPVKKDALIRELEANIPHPDILTLLTDEELTPEEVVELALGYDDLHA